LRLEVGEIYSEKNIQEKQKIMYVEIKYLLAEFKLSTTFFIYIT